MLPIPSRIHLDPETSWVHQYLLIYMTDQERTNALRVPIPAHLKEKAEELRGHYQTLAARRAS